MTPASTRFTALAALALLGPALSACGGAPVRGDGFRVTALSIAEAPGPGINIDAFVTIERTTAAPGDRVAVPIELLDSDAFLRFGDDKLDEGTAFVAPQSNDGRFRFTTLDCSATLTVRGRSGDSGEGGPGLLGIGSDDVELYISAGGRSSSQLPIAPCNP